jgi:hypothetical protein
LLDGPERMTSTEVILGAQAIASGAMCGLIWFVQVVHYPLFARVGGDGSKAYAAEHQRRTTLVVGPLMLVEIATAALIALKPSGRGSGVHSRGPGVAAVVAHLAVHGAGADPAARPPGPGRA